MVVARESSSGELQPNWTMVGGTLVDVVKSVHSNQYMFVRIEDTQGDEKQSHGSNSPLSRANILRLNSFARIYLLLVLILLSGFRLELYHRGPRQINSIFCNRLTKCELPDEVRNFLTIKRIVRLTLLYLTIGAAAYSGLP